MSKRSGVKGSTVAQVSRRTRVIAILEQTLKRGTKTIKNGPGLKKQEWARVQEQLSDKDIVRIKKELEILKTRV
jgi:hypothetical protein